MSRMFTALAFALVGAIVAPGAAAQSDYPNKAVTMVVPVPPGGVADITARPLAETMGRMLKQPVIVENKAGAGGGVGMQNVSKAKPDGYTMLMALSSISIIPEADKVLGRDPMFLLSQLTRRAMAVTAVADACFSTQPRLPHPHGLPLGTTVM